MRHKPVLVRESLGLLGLKPGDTVVDGTLGAGGHSLALAQAVGKSGRLIALDRDPAALERCRELLKDYPVSFHHENFRNLKKILGALNLSHVDAVFLDVGMSSEQLEDAVRGFSFERPGPLDMRMDPNTEVSAQDLVNDLSEHELARILWEFGEERRSRRFAKAIVEERKNGPIETTDGLVKALAKALPRGFHSKRHPATRVFQALRIVTNDELGALREGLTASWESLAPGGRLAVISFHSLEDRIVKYFFRARAKEDNGVLLVKKPVTPDRAEYLENPRARSAKLRALQKPAGPGSYLTTSGGRV